MADHSESVRESAESNQEQNGRRWWSMWLCRCTDGREFRSVLKDTLRANVVDIAAIADQLLYHRHLTPGAHPVRDIARGADV